MVMNPISSFDYVVLHCRDVQAAREFYRQVMGLPISQERADRIQFQVGASALVSRPCDEGPHARRAEGLPVQLGFRVRNHEVDACYEHLKAAGVEVLEPPNDQGWGRRTLFFKDPEGNLLEVYANLTRKCGG